MFAHMFCLRKYTAWILYLLISKWCSFHVSHPTSLNPLTAGAAYIQVFIFYQHIKYHRLNMLKISCDINQQDLKTVDLHFVKSE